MTIRAFYDTSADMISCWVLRIRWRKMRGRLVKISITRRPTPTTIDADDMSRCHHYGVDARAGAEQ